MSDETVIYQLKSVMMKSVHCISGLPRSGSTLLAAILSQNPRFHAGVTSPLTMLIGNMQRSMSANTEFGHVFDDERRERILRAIFSSFYSDLPSDNVVFDTNRSWTGRAALAAKLYPQSRIICCVREVAWIIDSIERMLNKNPTQFSRVFNFQPGASIYTRVDFLMNTEKGVIGQALATLREAWFGEEAKRLIIVPYDQLTAAPKQVMQQLYFELGEPEFAHDFEHVHYDASDYDARLGMPGLHKVREKVVAELRLPSIPPEIFVKHANVNFWNNQDANPRGVCILGQSYGQRRETVAH